MKKAQVQALKLLYEDEFKRAADEDGSRTSVYLHLQYYPTEVVINLKYATVDMLKNIDNQLAFHTMKW